MKHHKVASIFYKKLFEQYPEVKQFFSANSSDLMEKLMSVLELVVFSFEKKSNHLFSLQDNLIVPLRDLGKLHERKGIKAEHYLIANNLLLQTIEEEAGAAFSYELREIWRAALDHLSLIMQDSSIDTTATNEFSDDSFFREKFRQIFGL